MSITINIYYRSDEPGNAAAFAEEMERRGIALTDERVYKNGRLIAVWLRDEVGGFAIHLLEK